MIPVGSGVLKVLEAYSTASSQSLLHWGTQVPGTAKPWPITPGLVRNMGVNPTLGATFPTCIASRIHVKDLIQTTCCMVVEPNLIMYTVYVIVTT